MLKQAAMLEVEKNGKKYQLHLPSDSPLGDVHDVEALQDFYQDYFIFIALERQTVLSYLVLFDCLELRLEVF